MSVKLYRVVLLHFSPGQCHIFYIIIIIISIDNGLVIDTFYR
jgi:hypothetical protein